MSIKLGNGKEAQNLTNKCVNVMYSKIDEQKIGETNLAAITCKCRTLKFICSHYNCNSYKIVNRSFCDIAVWLFFEANY